MPPKTAKRRAKAAPGGDGVWGFLVDRPRKRTRASTSRIDEGSEETERKGNEQFQSWVEWQKKFNDKEKEDKRHFASTFKQNIENNREAIQNLISKSKESLNNTGRQYTELVKDGCAGFEATAQPTSDSRAGSPLFKAGQELFRKYRDLVAIHEQANSKASAQGINHTNERRSLWKTDMEQTQKAVVYGAQYGEKVIQCNIDMSSSDENKAHLIAPSGSILNGPGQMALDMHQRSIEKLMKGEPTWGAEALKYLDKFVSIAAVCELEAEGIRAE